MKICFYNLNHIGDVYFLSLFLNIICKQNENNNFFYYTINGDAFLENINNLTRIYNNIEKDYSDKLINGNAPETLLNNIILNILLSNKMETDGAKILNVLNEEILFVNTWCNSAYLNYTDFDLTSGIDSHKGLILKLNHEFNLSLKFDININHIKESIQNISFYENHNIIKDDETDLKETIFIFNFKPRSLTYDMNMLNRFISNLSINNKIILSSYDSLFDNFNNIKFIDKNYGIFPIPSCKNLVYIWEIAVKCKKIFLLPTGSSLTFLHKLKDIKKDQIYMLNDLQYCNRLNDNINLLVGENINLIGVEYFNWC